MGKEVKVKEKKGKEEESIETTQIQIRVTDSSTSRQDAENA